MATATKTENGTAAAEAFADVAAKASQEAKVVTETVLDAGAKVNENVKAVLDAQQKMLHDSFKVWQQYNQGYINFVASATKQTLEQSLALTEQLSKVAEGNWKKAQELMVAEQEFVLNESVALRERLGKIAESNWKKVQEVAGAEQTVALEAAEAFQTQVQATSERFAKVFTPNFK